MAWTIESVPRTTGKNTQETRRQITRWHTASGLGTAAPIFCMGVAPGKEVPSFDFAKGDGWIALARMQQIDAADDLETLIKNGLRLRRATTFGRPS